MPKNETVDINTLLQRAVIGCLVNGVPCLLDGEKLVIIPLDKLPELAAAVKEWLENRKQFRGK